MLARLIFSQRLIYSFSRFRGFSFAESQIPVHRMMLQNQIQQASDSPIHILELYNHKRQLLDPSEKIMILSQVTNLLYAMKNSSKIQKYGYRFWIETIKRNKNFHELMEDLEKEVSQLEPDNLAIMCIYV